MRQANHLKDIEQIVNRRYCFEVENAGSIPGGVIRKRVLIGVLTMNVAITHFLIYSPVKTL